MIKTQIVIKTLLAGVIALFITSCTKDDFTPAENNGVWQKVNIITSVEEGKEASISTREIGELDPGPGLPSAHYPDKAGLHIHKRTWEKGAKRALMTKDVITLREENASSNSIEDFEYQIDANAGVVHLKQATSKEAQITLRIEEKYDTFEPQDVFCFNSVKEVSETIEFPELKPEDNLYPLRYKNATAEYGDKLFTSTHYFFAWTDDTKTQVNLCTINLKYAEDYGQYGGSGQIKEVVKIDKDWNTASWKLTMQRLTSCFSARLIIVDTYKDNKVTNIAGIDGSTDFKDALSATNAALNKYIDEEGIDIPHYGVENIFVRKKLLNEFPYQYNWIDGLVPNGSNPSRKPLYLCNLDYPAWINSVTFYGHGNNQIYGVTSICDSEPFIPTSSISGGGIPNIELHFFIGIGQRDGTEHPDEEHPGSTYEKAIILKVPFYNNYSIVANQIENLYVILTVKNLVELYQKLQAPPVNTRSSEIEMTLPAEQLIIASEPYHSM